MPYHYEATSEFMQSVSEVEKLVALASSDDENRTLFLKLAAVSLVTKFQVFVENALDEFRYKLNGMTSGRLSLYMKMNAIHLSMTDDNVLTGIQKHHNFTEEKKNKIVDYLNSISFISDDDAKINESFKFTTKYLIGKTGKNNLKGLLSQIDGDQNPFEGFNKDDFNKLDSVLQTRHLIVHQDRFTGTETTVEDSITFIKKLVEYIDEYLSSKVPV